MTYLGAIKQLHELRAADDMPIFYKPAIAEVINVLLMDVQEVKHGYWTKISPAGIYECSQCGQNVMTGDIEVYAYCHHCGAYMKEDTDATN